jgi:hypothetical protein
MHILACSQTSVYPGKEITGMASMVYLARLRVGKAWAARRPAAKWTNTEGCGLM